jgi:hypothetical protein
LAYSKPSIDRSIEASQSHPADSGAASLAYCELYVALGTLFRRFDRLKVYRTRPQDLVYDDFFSPYHPVDARKFYVVGEVPLESRS